MADDVDIDDDNNNVFQNNDVMSSSVFYSRVVVIFVFTELLLRTVYTATAYSGSSIKPPTTAGFKSLNELLEWWNYSEMVKTFLDFRVWRIIQLCLLALVYFYQLVFRIEDDGDEDDY